MIPSANRGATPALQFLKKRADSMGVVSVTGISQWGFSRFATPHLEILCHKPLKFPENSPRLVRNCVVIVKPEPRPARSQLAPRGRNPQALGGQRRSGMDARR